MSWNERPEDSPDECGDARTVLVISSLEDFLLLARMLDRPSLNLLGVRTCRAARSILLQNLVPVVISDRNLSDGCWKDVLCAGGSSERPPHLVVASQLADGSLWAEVLNLGGYDVLTKPFDATEVNRALDSALRNWMWRKADRPGSAATHKHFVQRAN